MVRAREGLRPNARVGDGGGVRLWIPTLLGLAIALSFAASMAAFPLPPLFDPSILRVECPAGSEAVSMRAGQRAVCELAAMGDRQHYELEARAGDRLLIQVAQTGGFGEPCLELSRGSGEIEATTCEANNPRLEPLLGSDGPWRVSVWDEGDDDLFAYHLMVRRLSPAVVEMPLLHPQTPRSASLDSLGDLHLYRFETLAGQVVRFQLSSRSTEAQPCLVLWRRGERLPLTLDDASGSPCGGSRLRIERRFEIGGSVILGVFDENDDVRLDYTLVAQTLAPQPPATRRLGSWERLEGRIDPVGSFDTYGLEGVAGEVFTLRGVAVGGGGRLCFELLRPDTSVLAVDCARRGEGDDGVGLDITLEGDGLPTLLISAEETDQPMVYGLGVIRVVPPAISAEPLPRGVFRQGQLAGGAVLALYTFPGEVGAEGVIELVSRGGFGEPCLELRRPDGELQAKACAPRGETSVRYPFVVEQAGSQVLLVFDQGLDESLPYRLSLSAGDATGAKSDQGTQAAIPATRKSS